MNKLFIVFEGIDSSGKTTQAELLKKHLVVTKEGGIISSEPSNGIIGNLIRQALKKRLLFCREPALFDQQMAYLFAADRHDHLYNDVDGVYQLIRSGQHVISTRYYFSSLAYNCETDAQYNFVRQLNEQFPWPDLTIFLDIPIEVSLARLQERSLQEVYETEAKLTKVKERYHELFANYQGELLFIDGTKNSQEIHELIVERVQSLIETK